MFNFILFDLGLFFMFQNIFLMMLLFWMLSWLGDKLYKNKHYVSNTEVYECGFLSTHNLNVTFNLSFFLMMMLLILYDMEFFFLIPFFFNFLEFTTMSMISFWIFFIFVLLSFMIDWQSMVLDWMH